MDESRESSPPPTAADPLRVLYLDDDFVAVAKPSGLLVHRDEHHPAAPAALQMVRDQFGRFVYPFHRLDRATSGILLFAFSSAMAAALQQNLAAPEARKEYLALMRHPGSNRTLQASWSCDRPLTDDKEIERPCRTGFEVIEAYDRVALVRCRLSTGRYHQIRRHANHCGRHVIGDTTHGKGRINAWFRARYGLNRLFLHLEHIGMQHPRRGGRIEIIDPLPEELQRTIDGLRRDQAAAPAC